jgi:hypothetical protein
MADHQLRVRHGAPDHRAFRKEECSKQMAAHLAKRGHDVTVVTGRPLLRRANNRFDGVRVVYVRCPDLPRFAYAAEYLHGQVAAAFHHLDEGHLAYHLSQNATAGPRASLPTCRAAGAQARLTISR